MADAQVELPQEVAGLKQFDNKVDLAPFIAFQDEHAWAFHKSLMFPRIGVFYSLIPKNACTSLLSAFAKESGLTSPWFHTRNRIHNIQSRFWAFRELDRFHDDSFKIIAFRNPFKRALSAFNNKLVGTDADHQVHQRFFEKRLNKKIADCRLSDIIRVADRCPHWMLDEHFAPQWSFIFYDHYDLIIDADHKVSGLELEGREIAIAHENKKSKPRSDEDLGDAPISEIRKFIDETGTMPSLTGQQEIFRRTIKRDGNYVRDFLLYGALA